MNVTLRVTLPDKSYAASVSDKMIEFFISKKKFGSYYWQLEQGDVLGKWHLQGWISTDYAKSTIEQQKSNPFRPFIKKLLPDAEYSMAKVLETSYYSYISNNLEKKKYVTDVWTTFSSEYLEEIPVFVDKETFISDIKIRAGNLIKVKKKPSWHQETIKLLEETCLIKNHTNDLQIQYHLIEEAIRSRLPKAMDQSVYDRNLLGVMFHLEDKYRNKYNRKVTHEFHNNFKIKYGHLFI